MAWRLWLGPLFRPEKATGGEHALGTNAFAEFPTTAGVDQMFVLRKGEKVEVTLVDEFGEKASADGIPVWRVVPTDIVTVLPANDGMSAVLEASGHAGVTTLTVEADVDLGDGVDLLRLTEEIKVVGGRPKALEFGETLPI